MTSLEAKPTYTYMISNKWSLDISAGFSFYDYKVESYIYDSLFASGHEYSSGGSGTIGISNFRYLSNNIALRPAICVGYRHLNGKNNMEDEIGAALSTSLIFHLSTKMLFEIKYNMLDYTYSTSFYKDTPEYKYENHNLNFNYNFNNFSIGVLYALMKRS